jgi:hypothetical protein
MRIVVSGFISLDGVVQAPGGPEEDTDRGFRHGGWSMPYFHPDTMGPAVGEIMAATEAPLSAGVPGRRWPPPGPTGRGTRSPTDERDQKVRGVTHAEPTGPHLVQLDVAAGRRRHTGVLICTYRPVDR